MNTLIFIEIKSSLYGQCQVTRHLPKLNIVKFNFLLNLLIILKLAQNLFLISNLHLKLINLIC